MSGKGAVVTAGSGQGEETLFVSRWLMLFYLSMLSGLSDWVCFSMAPISHIAEESYGVDESFIIDVFFFTNVCFCFVEVYVVARFGLRFAVCLGSVLMMLGCFIKAGVPVKESSRFWEVVLGTVFVGAAQPFFQITPPLLVARWFGSKERTAASGVCINANQIGIGFAFILGPLTVKDEYDIQEYFFWIAMLAAVLCFGTCLQFRSFPPEPPLPASQDNTKREPETPMELLNESLALWSAPGFAVTVAAFCVSFTNTNVISSFLNTLMHPAGYTNNEIGFTGALFQVAIMVGSIFFGTLVDETRMYKTATVWLLGATTIVLFLCTYLDFAMLGVAGVTTLIMLLGVVDGPIMPISSEAAVEVTYPANENMIMANQMLTGNLISFCLLPVFHQGTEMARDRQQAFWLLIFITVICGVVFLKRFNGKFARARLEGFDFGSFSTDEGLYGSVAVTLCIEPSQDVDEVLLEREF